MHSDLTTLHRLDRIIFCLEAVRDAFVLAFFLGVMALVLL
jgi:hypothetical protein